MKSGLTPFRVTFTEMNETETRPGTLLVTGGSRGIGEAIVRAACSSGWQVAFTWASDAARARTVETGCEGRARAFALDLRDHARPNELVREIEASLGPITGLVNNAGTSRDGLLAMTSDADWEHVIEIDLSGVFRCCRAVLPSMLRA